MKRKESHFEDTVLPQGEQSSLEQFVHHALPHRPNAVHEVGRQLAQKEKAGVPAGDNYIAPAARAARAEREGTLHGALYYTLTENSAQSAKRVEESDEAVVSRMNSKEEFPQG